MTRVEIANQFVDRLQELEALFGDLRADCPTIAAFATTADEPACFQSIEQARDVGLPAREPFADLPTSQPVCLRVFQRLQHAVLAQRQPEGPQRLAQTPREQFRNTQDAEKHAPLGGAARFEGAVHSLHNASLDVVNDYCQELLLFLRSDRGQEAGDALMNSSSSVNFAVARATEVSAAP